MAHQEQYNPSQLLQYAELAEEAGDGFVWTSDHFQPWFHTNVKFGFTWSWLGSTIKRVGDEDLLEAELANPDLRDAVVPLVAMLMLACSFS
jgi:alkanesulfonate monooxygenase SsuD/methylene tetrahydromethanopterin reductase-like flavin-dependent oxidoreductase (luciferase family)